VEALRFAEALARSCARALGETVAGVILHGSLTRADYLPGRSDVDLLVMVDGPLTDAQVADWEAIGDDAELTVLTTCRVWRFAEEGRHCPRPRPRSGRWGAIPRFGWSATLST
jgi:predicted nucleotidyltransferase